MTHEEMLAAEAQLIQAIGRQLNVVASVRGPGVVYYAEPSETRVESAVFAGDDAEMTLTVASTELSTLVRELWRVRREGAPGQGWAALTFVLLDGDFRVTYIAPNEMYAGADANERCKTMIRAIMGPVNVRAS